MVLESIKNAIKNKKRYSTIENGVLVKFDKRDLVSGKYIMPDDIVEIGNEAFSGCEKLKQIEFSKNLEKIGVYAFLGCKELTEVFIPDSVKEIGKDAFLGCENLSSVRLPSGLKELKRDVFRESGLKSIEIPNTVKKIGVNCFAHCNALKKIIIPDSVEEVDVGAFIDCTALEEVVLPKNIKKLSNGLFEGCKNLKKVNIPEGVVEIGRYAFERCTKLIFINIPDSVEKICDGAFYGAGLTSLEMSDKVETTGSIVSDCKNLKKIIYSGKEIPCNKDIIDLWGNPGFMKFLLYAMENKVKFIPKNSGIMLATANPADYYAHSKDWSEVLRTYTKKWGEFNGQLDVKNPDSSKVVPLYKACVILGLFQDDIAPSALRTSQKESMNSVAKRFILNSIVEIPPDRMEEYFGRCASWKIGFQYDFATFFIKNYREEMSVGGDLVPFLSKKVSSFVEELDDNIQDVEDDIPETEENQSEIVNYIKAVYEGWKTIEETYPNRVKLIPDRETGSENNNLTESEVIDVVTVVKYNNVLEGNEKLAEICGRYGYTQAEFDELQEWWEISKTIKQEDKLLQVEADSLNEKGIKYELLLNNDLETAFLGEETNCCQVVNNAGKECLEYGMTKLNSGFIKFSYNGAVIGQAWVWYNPKTKVVCLDNIELPTIWEKRMEKYPQFSKYFLDSLKRMSKGLYLGMQNHGFEVKAVTVGSGWNSLKVLESLNSIEGKKSPVPEDYGDKYTDSDEKQFVLTSFGHKKIVPSEVTTV